MNGLDEQDLKIELEFNRKDFEEIYFIDNQLSYYKSEETKRPFQHLMISLFVLIPFLYFSLTEDKVEFLTIALGLIFIFNLIRYAISVYQINKKRSRIKVYLDEVQTIKKHRLELNNREFKIIQDDITTKEVWSDFTGFETNDSFLYLISKSTDYLIPKKSMSIFKYEELKSILNQKIK